jgi:tetratricopeptide (TPR) repeat protein
MQSGQSPRKLGLIIGVNHYQDSTFRALRFAENDAKALAQWFVNGKGGKWNPPDVQLVQGQHVTKTFVESSFAQLCLQIASTGDNVVFYFAGHAFVDERSGEGYLALANTRYQDASTAINIRTLLQSSQSQSRAGHILCIFDCFQTGPVWDMRRTSQYDSKPLLGAATLAALQQVSNRLCLCSCRGSTMASETGESKLGEFAHRMLLGLCGPAAESATGNVALTKLHAYLFKNLSEQHRPQLFGQQTAPFILVDNSVSAALSTTQLSSSPSYNGSRVDQGVMSTPEPSKGSLLKNYAAPASMSASAIQPASALPNLGQSPSPSGPLQKAAPDGQQQRQSKQVLEQAQKCMQNQNYKEAFSLIEQLLHLAPNDIEALTLKGQLLGTAGRLEEASATVEQILQNEPENALAWSMRAVLLNNMGQSSVALSAIERSLELDASNPESYGIKTHIMESVAAAQTQNGERAAKLDVSQGQMSRGISPEVTKDNARAFFIGAGLQVLGFILGTVGAASTYVLHQTTTPYASLAIVCLGLAIMCVVAAQGAFRYGFTRLIPTIALTFLSVAILGGAYVLAFTRIIANIQAQTQITNQAAIARLLAFGFIGIWLAAAALLPLIGCISGLVVGLVVRKRAIQPG